MFLDKKSSVPLWKQIEFYIKEAIKSGVLEVGKKLPSIRELALQLNVSRCPVENAYVELQIQGYIESRPKSGYFVSTHLNLIESKKREIKILPSNNIEYDFRRGQVDKKTADVLVWQKYLRKALSNEEEIISHGDPQGEIKLREAIAEYTYLARGVKCTSENVVIATGTQHLLTLLCRFVGEKKRVAIEAPGFLQAEQIFTDFGWKKKIINKTENIIQVLEKEKINIFTEITSNMPYTSLSVMTNRRNLLLTWAKEKSSYIIEDDFNGELRYLSRSIPALQGLSPERVIYIGSFSNLLLPSVRIAYMVLPYELMRRVGDKIENYAQTASKIEQLALAEYIKDKKLEKHLKRSRKIYSQKVRKLVDAININFMNAKIKIFETSMSVSVEFEGVKDYWALQHEAVKNGIELDVITVEDSPKIALSFSGVEENKIEEAVRKLAEVWQKFKI
ncbi:MAG: PLP-dependent aminotransferase family protein [Synergistaceae bacterium]